MFEFVLVYYVAVSVVVCLCACVLVSPRVYVAINLKCFFFRDNSF